MARTINIEKLREKETAIRAQIKAAEAAEARRNEEGFIERCTIIGVALVAEMTDDQDLAARLEPVIDRRVTKIRERKLLGLKPKTKQKK